MKILKVSRILIGFLLLLALFKLPMGYYHFLRAAVIIISVLNIFVGLKYMEKFYLIFFISAIILFNPIIPFKFSSGLWNVIDVIYGVIFIISGLTMRSA
ncbi:MAG: hypothetical protein JW866_05250 [Ignavibacteriales bacterium]|nr:hypothetical protein [Ignavibacteriales bacterium]